MLDWIGRMGVRIKSQEAKNGEAGGDKKGRVLFSCIKIFPNS